MSTSILWLRRDLRLADNPALSAALEGGRGVVIVYIHSPEDDAPWSAGAASRWWLHHSLESLSREIEERGGRLILRRGPTLDALLTLAREVEADEVLWNRRYEPARVALDTELKRRLRREGLGCDSFNASLLLEPWTVQTGAGEPYRVFTAFWRACLRLTWQQSTVPVPVRLPAPPRALTSVGLEDLALLPKHPWDGGLAETWQPGEPGALRRLDDFIEGALSNYAQGRDVPGQAGTSRLSPHLHFGEVGPRQVAARIAARGGEHAEAYVRELGWREFAYHILYHYPHTTDAPMDGRFERFPWAKEYTGTLQSWQRGQTGIPIVDAGMRELWHTGWMHNRVRMIVASLLTKNLLVPWQEGARWFWDTLVDADLASNSMGWQWTAGSGADAAPYFRIFNPVRQGERFDPRGEYVRRWVPELSTLAARWIHQPWEAPTGALGDAGLELGRDYPRPMVDLADTRRRALAAFDAVKRG